MDRNCFVWVLQSCMFNLDEVSKKDLLEFGCPETLADIGKELYEYLINKEIPMEKIYGR